MSTNGDILKNKMLAALEANLGIVSNAAKQAKISRNTHYEWLKSDPIYKAKVDELENIALDFAESQLFEKIKGVQIADGENVYKQPPSDTAIIFYLKTKGKKRGYIEKQEIDHSGEIKGVQIQLIANEGDK